MKKSSFPPILFIALGAVILLAGANAFLYREIRKADANALSRRSEQEFAETEGVRIAAMKASLDKTSAERGKLDSYLIGKDGAVAFLEELEKTGDAAGVVLSVDSVAQDTYSDATSTAPVLRVALSASGTWKQVILFAEDIRALPHRMAFSRLSFQRVGDAPAGKTGQPAWKADIEFIAAQAQ